MVTHKQEKKIIRDLMEDFRKKDQEFLETNHYETLEAEELGTIYRKLGEMHMKEVKKLYNEGEQTEIMIQRINKPAAKEIGDQIAHLGIAHHLLAREYNQMRHEFGELEEKTSFTN